MPNPVRPALTPLSRRPAFDRGAAAGGWFLPVVGFTVAAVITVSAGFAYYQRQKVVAAQDARHQVELVSQLKLRQLEAWRDERLSDALVMQERLAALNPLSTDASGRAEPAESFTRWLRTYVEAYADYDQAVLVRMDGTVAGQAPSSAPLPESVVTAALEAARTRRPRLYDFHADAGGGVHMRLLVPVLDGVRGREPMGAVIVRIDPRATLIPLLDATSGAFQTLATQLLRRENGHVLLIHQRGSDMQERVPLTAASRLAVKALTQQGFVEGIDYSGKPVVAWVAPVTGLDWYLVTRVEGDELQAIAVQQVRAVPLLVSLMLFAVGAVITLLTREQRLRAYRAQAGLVSALSDRDERLQIALSAGNLALFEVDMQAGRIVTSSAQYAGVLGYTEDALRRQTDWLALLHPDDRAAAVAAYEACVTGAADDYRSQYRIKAADGRWRWVLSVGRVVERTSSGQPLKLLGTRADVTEFREAQERLAEVADTLSALLSNSPTIIYRLTRAGDHLVPTRLSENVDRVLGYRVEEALAPTWWPTHLHPDDRDGAMGAMGRLEADDEVTHEYRFARQDGTYLWVSDSLRVVRRDEAGRPVEVVGAWNDITSRKQAERRIETLNRLYLSLSRCNEAIVRCTTEAELFPRICEAAVDAGGLAMAWIGMVDEDTGMLRTAAAYGSDLDYLEGIQISVDESRDVGRGPSGTAIRENAPQWVEHWDSSTVSEPWRARGAQHGWASAAALPLTREGRPVGGLMLYSREPAAFDAERRRLLMEMAADISFALSGFAREHRRQETERLLRHSEARYRNMFDQSGAPMLLLDAATGRILDANQAAVAFYGWELDTLRQMTVGQLNTLPPDQLLGELHLAAAASKRRFRFRHRLANGEFREIESFTAPMVMDERECVLTMIVDVTAQVQAEAALLGSLHEKEALLKEVHHRVKNNLQIVSSLLRLEGARYGDPSVRGVLGEMQNRIASMALLHETLYRSDNLNEANLATYLNRLVNQLFRAMAPSTGRVRLALELNDARVDLDQAVPCGLLVNELVSNSLKHGFPDDRAGEIRVSVETLPDDGRIQLVVGDTGVGLPTDFEERQKKSLGLQLVGDLTRQLRGTMTIGHAGGTSFSLEFAPHHASAARIAADPGSAPPPARASGT